MGVITNSEEQLKILDQVKQVNELCQSDKSLSIIGACKQVGLSISKFNYYHRRPRATSAAKAKSSKALAKVKNRVHHQTIIYQEPNERSQSKGSEKVIFFMGSSGAVESLKDILSTLINR